MTPNPVRRWIPRLGLVGTAVLATAACPENAAEITGNPSSPSFDFPVTSTFVTPVGTFTIDRVVLADVDLAVPDALGRTSSLIVDPPSFFGCGGPCATWELPFFNGSADTRLPALQDNDAGGNLGITLDSTFGAPLLVYNLMGLDPNTAYTFTLERLAVNINGELDHPNVLLNDPSFGALQRTPDAADALVRLDGSAGTALGDNYYEVGGFTTDATGTSGGLSFFGFTGTGQDDILETNALQSFSLPLYNYVVLYQGSPAAGIPVMRAQAGVELDGNGQPVNNALAPFPTAPLTTAQVLAAPGGAGRPDSLTVTFSNLEVLTGAAEYEAWLVNPATGNTALATGTYNLIQIIAERDPITGEVISTRDSLASSTSGVSSFAGGDEGDGFRHQLVISDAALGGGAGDTVGLSTSVVLTIASAPGGAISDSRPIWATYTNQNETPFNFTDDSFTMSGSTSFGNFEVAGAASSRTFSGEGGGLGGFRADVLSLDLESISRPPVGYSYVGWLIRQDGAAVRLADITGPAPDFVGLVGADVELIDGVVTTNGILNANIRGLRDDLGITYKNFPLVLITLEPKAGDPAIGPIVVHQGVTPDRVLNP